MSKLPEIKSEFALLDVRGDTMPLREALLEAEKTGKKIRVHIHGDIVGTWSGHDGTSQEFQVEVLSVEIKEKEQK